MMGSCLNTCLRVLEMGLKRVYTLLRSWNRLEDFDQIFWGQKSALAGGWLPQISIISQWSLFITMHGSRSSLANLNIFRLIFSQKPPKMTKIKMAERRIF